METANLNKIKSPEPNLISKQEKEEPKRKIKRPSVGVVNVPKISTTPLADTLALNKQENPHTIYKLTNKKNPFVNIHNISSIGIFACAGIITLPLIKKGISSAFKMFKKIFTKK